MTTNGTPQGKQHISSAYAQELAGPTLGALQMDEYSQVPPASEQAGKVSSLEKH